MLLHFSPTYTFEPQIIYCRNLYFGCENYRTVLLKIRLLLILFKFIYSEKATNFCEISTVDLSYVVPVKSSMEISQNFVILSEYMNFLNDICNKQFKIALFLYK